MNELTDYLVPEQSVSYQHEDPETSDSLGALLGTFQIPSRTRTIRPLFECRSAGSETWGSPHHPKHSYLFPAAPSLLSSLLFHGGVPSQNTC